MLSRNERKVRKLNSGVKVLLTLFSCVVVAIILTMLTRSLLSERHSMLDETSKAYETSIEVIDGEVFVSTEYETEYSETISESVEYVGDILPEEVEVGRVSFIAGLQDYIHVDPFVNTISDLYGGGVVEDFAGGVYGVFNVRLRVGEEIIDGVWDDSSQRWYGSIKEYNDGQEEEG